MIKSMSALTEKQMRAIFHGKMKPLPMQGYKMDRVPKAKGTGLVKVVNELNTKTKKARRKKGVADDVE